MCARTLGIPILPTYVGILSRQLEGRESEKPNGHQSGNMGEKTEDRYTVSSPVTRLAGLSQGRSRITERSPVTGFSMTSGHRSTNP
jgi:hypothetical protein